MKQSLFSMPALILCWLLFFAGACNETKNIASQDQKQESKTGAIHKDLDTETFKTQYEKANNALLIDVRTPKEVAEGYIKNAKNIDFYNEKFMEIINELDKNQPIYLYCRSGGRSGEALVMLKDSGFTEVYNLLEGFNGWKAAGNDFLIPPQ